MDFLPLPVHAGQEVVLWPWHFGHNTFWGIVLLPRFQHGYKISPEPLGAPEWLKIAALIMDSRLARNTQ
jgi:hypothetical protein